MRFGLLAGGAKRACYAYTGGRAFDPSLPCVVFVHGALHDHSVWALHARWFAHHGHAVLAPDLPGHGRSGGPALSSVGAIAAWLVAMLSTAGVQRAALIGHSLGSLIALETAARLGDRAAHLVMVATAFPMRVAPALLDAARAEPLAAIDRVNALSHSTLAAKPSSPGPGTWLHGANRALMRRTQSVYAATGHGNLFVEDFLMCDSYDGAAEAAAALTCPVDVIVGSKDQMTPPRAALELARWSRARITALPCGHAVMQEAPDALLQALRLALLPTD